MGNRVKGRSKKKSVKAASHSGMGSKRKLSRMGKKQKKDNSGLDATFIGRSACLKRLQVSLKDFRRLCILKGIYPREPRGRAPKNKKGQVYYHIKDVRAIAHEPVLDKFREFRAFMKKIRRAAGRNEKTEAARKHAIAPTYTLHHLVRERYPRFQDALNDLDDALTLVNLFAALPKERSIKAPIIGKAKSLSAAWAAYCATTSSITKSFISVKGVYLEAQINGCTIRWICPHSFTQSMPRQVDFKVMLTFFEFYETLLSFVLFKLYNGLGLRYPLPIKDIGGQDTGNTSTVLAANLKALNSALRGSSGAVSEVVTESLERSKEEDGGEDETNKKITKRDKELIKTVGAALSGLKEEDIDDEDENEDVDVQGPLKAALATLHEEEIRTTAPGTARLDDEATKRRRLFAGLTFFLSREVPRGYLDLVCLAYGGKVGWEGDNSPIAINDPTITHHVVDRPKLPPHLKRFKSREIIQPQWILDCSNFMFLLPVKRYELGAELPPHLSPWVDNDEEGYKPEYAEEIERLQNGETLDDDGESIDDAVEETTEEGEALRGSVEENEKSDDEVNDEEEDDSESEAKVAQKKEKEEKDTHDRAKIMMSKKASRLYGRMQHGLEKKQAEIDKLYKKREDMKGKEKGADGKTVLKQKVERLKKERKAVIDEYSTSSGSMKKKKRRTK